MLNAVDTIPDIFKTLHQRDGQHERRHGSRSAGARAGAKAPALVVRGVASPERSGASS